MLRPTSHYARRLLCGAILAATLLAAAACRPAGEAVGEGTAAPGIITRIVEQITFVTRTPDPAQPEEVRDPIILDLSLSGQLPDLDPGRAETDAQLVAENVALQLERRISFRRAMKKAIQLAMDMGAEGVKIRCAGRLGGAELARVETYHLGRVPLHTLRANIDYGFAEAKTVYGKLGVKCWVCRGERKPEKQLPAGRTAGAAPTPAASSAPVEPTAAAAV